MDIRSGTTRLLLLVFTLLALQGAAWLVSSLAADSPDRAHPVLHLVTGTMGFAVLAGSRPVVGFGLVLGAAYTLLGVAGALGLVQMPWLLLNPIDHVFHVALGATVAGLAGAESPRMRRFTWCVTDWVGRLRSS